MQGDWCSDAQLSELKLTLAKTVWAAFISEMGRVAANKATLLGLWRPEVLGVCRSL